MVCRATAGVHRLPMVIETRPFGFRARLGTPPRSPVHSPFPIPQEAPRQLEALAGFQDRPRPVVWCAHVCAFLLVWGWSNGDGQEKPRLR